MSQLFSLSLSVGLLPDRWKVARVAPVFTNCPADESCNTPFRYPRTHIRYESGHQLGVKNSLQTVCLLQWLHVRSKVDRIKQ